MTQAALRSFLDRPDAVIFVGSGISCWSGLPTWRRLISDLADFLDAKGENSVLIREEAASGDLLQAASYGFSKLSPQEIGEFVRKAVKFGSAKPCEIHKAIVELGPSCYITTNFDNLIEQALSQWQPNAFYPPPVTNGHLAGIADILSARSLYFIFKPHGDAGDAASIVLTREQYRMLLPDGERHRALEALKTLLVTRPVLYLGFGLRDPDFLYLRDLLLNIFQGATRNHYAIMSDIHADEADYWRRQYGIRLVGYKTHASADGTRDHRELLAILTSLATNNTSHPKGVAKIRTLPAEDAGSSRAERILALTRYSAGLMRLAPEQEAIEIRVSSSQEGRPDIAHIDLFENWTAVNLLTKGPARALLIGLPGAGKSFAARLATARLAQTVQQACIDDTVDTAHLVLPVLIDLKLYQGNLRAHIDNALPAGFSLRALLGKIRLKLLLDAANEMPSNYLEDGSLFASLEELRDEVGNFDYVITSRTLDGLATHGIPRYELARFDLDYVDHALAARGIVLSGHFEKDTRWLLSRPFFLQLVTSGQVKVPESARPGDIYSSFKSDLQTRFSERFYANQPLTTALSRIAFRAIGAGREAFPLTWLTDELLMIVDRSQTTSQNMVNWLIVRGALIPYSGGRASFVHQSITEYCAALELVRLCNIGAFSLRDTVALKKWDQCLFMALGMMDAGKAEETLDFLTRADLELAFSAVRYAEENQSAALGKLLAILVERVRNDSAQIPRHLSLSRLPIGLEHVTHLEALLNSGGSLAGEAIEVLARIHGPAFKSSLIELLDRNKDDYNFTVNGIVPALKPFLERSDILRLLNMVTDTESTEDDEIIWNAIGELLSDFDPDVLINSATHHETANFSSGMIKTISWALHENEDKRSLDIISGFVLQSYGEAITSLYFRLPRNYDTDGIKQVGDLPIELVHAVWKARFDEDFWDETLRRFCSLRSDFADEVASIAITTQGIERIALLSCLDNKLIAIHEELEALASLSDDELAEQPLDIFKLADLDWSGTGSLFPNLLVRNIAKLRTSMLGGSSPCRIEGLSSFGPNELAPVVQVAASLYEEGESWWNARQLGSIVAQYGDHDMRGCILEQLARGEPTVRTWIKDSVLPFIENLSTDDMSDDAISFLLADLSRDNAVNDFWDNSLGCVASERFVIERLIPLAQGGSETILTNLRIVLKAAGNRHGRRYLLPN